MSIPFDALEMRDPAERERHLFARLPEFLRQASANAPGLANWLAGVDLDAVGGRAQLAALPVLRKTVLMEFQAENPPFGGFADIAALQGGRVFQSPGPLWEPQGLGADPWAAARAFLAAGIRPGDIVHNAFAYHMTPGGFILDEGARALGCTVFPAGTGNTDMQVEAAATLRPRVYCGTPDFLKVMLDRAAEMGKDLSSLPRWRWFRRARCFRRCAPNMPRAASRCCNATPPPNSASSPTRRAADDGTPNPGMIVNENLIVEIVRPGTGDPVAGRRGRRSRRHQLQSRLPAGAARHRRPVGDAARPFALRAHQHQDQGLDGPRRPAHQGQGHVRRSKAGRRDRAAASRNRQGASGRRRATANATP